MVNCSLEPPGEDQIPERVRSWSPGAKKGQGRLGGAGPAGFKSPLKFSWEIEPIATSLKAL